MGNEKHNKTSVGVTVRLPPSRKAQPRTVENKGRMEVTMETDKGVDVGWKKVIGGGSEGGQMTGRRTTNRDQGGDDGRRSQEGLGAGRARRDPGHSHDGGPRWSQRREEPWRRNGRSHGGGMAEAMCNFFLCLKK